MKVVHNSTCKMAFGKFSKHSDCPRCEELKLGAKPRPSWNTNRYENLSKEYAYKHDCIESKCGHVCTYGDW